MYVNKKDIAPPVKKKNVFCTILLPLTFFVYLLFLRSRFVFCNFVVVAMNNDTFQYNNNHQHRTLCEMSQFFAKKNHNDNKKKLLWSKYFVICHHFFLLISMVFRNWNHIFPRLLKWMIISLTIINTCAEVTFWNLQTFLFWY